MSAIQSPIVTEDEDVSSMLEMKISLEDDDLIDMVDLCGKYAELQTKISKELSRGYFLMAKARKNTGRINCDSLRDEFDANYRVDCDAKGEYTAWVTKPKSDPILLVTALPPPDLRHSQKCFQDSLTTVIQLASKLNAIKQKMGSSTDEKTTE
jgi:hypothetical protein